MASVWTEELQANQNS